MLSSHAVGSVIFLEGLVCEGCGVTGQDML